MAEITTTQSFSDGDTVTATKLNNIQANASVQPDAITNRTAETTIDQANDLLLIYDASATALKKVSASNLIKAGTASDFPITGNATIGGTLGVTGAITASTSIINVGSGQIFKDASGNVGVGTASPSQPVELVKSFNGATWFSVSNANSSSGALAGYLMTNDTGALGALQLNSTTNVTSGAGNAVVLRTLSTNPLIFGTNSTERLRIDSSGNVGVGTDSPSSKLQVGKTTDSSNVAKVLVSSTGIGYIGVDSTGIVSGCYLVTNNSGSTQNGIPTATSGILSQGSQPFILTTNSVERLRIDSSGNVIITSNKALISRGGSGVSSNSAVGEGALQANTTGYQNTANGYQALYSNTTGADNTANGISALYSNTTGANNTASGVSALSSNTTGSRNVASGYLALQSNTTGANNTAIGVNALGSNSTGTNISGFGQDAQVTGSNQVQLGDSATTVYAYGAVQDRSDIRDKSDIRNTTLGLGFINSLRPVDFKWDMREDYRTEAPAPVDKPTELKEDASDEDKAKYQNDLSQYNSYIVLKDAWLEAVKLSNITHDGSKKRNRYHHGLIAQEVETLLNDSDIDFGGYQDHSIKGGDDVKSIGYGELIAPLIKAIQELSAKVTALEAA